MEAVKEGSPQKVKNVCDPILLADIEPPSSWQNSPGFPLKKHYASPSSLKEFDVMGGMEPRPVVLCDRPLGVV